MIGGQTVSGFFTQVVILGQPLFWMHLYDSDFKIPSVSKFVFYFTGFAFLSLIFITQFSIGFYTSMLFIQYAVMTMMATTVFNIKYRFKEAVSLAFLVTFMNSFYWEIPLHLAEFLSGAPHVGMLVQLWRLVPVVWLLEHYEFNDASKRTLAKGLLFSLILNVIAYLQLGPKLVIHAVIRFGCLYFLMKTIIEAKHKSSTT